MNIIDAVENNSLLKELFPNGLIGPVLLSGVNLHLDNRVSIFLETHQEPHKKIDKWGTWNRAYNTIDIEMVGQPINALNITDWQNNRACNLVVSKTESNINLLFQDEDFMIELDFGTLTFKKCATYIDCDVYIDEDYDDE